MQTTPNSHAARMKKKPLVDKFLESAKHEAYRLTMFIQDNQQRYAAYQDMLARLLEQPRAKRPKRRNAVPKVFIPRGTP